MHLDVFTLTTFDRKKLLDDVDDPTRLSNQLAQLPPTKRSACMVALIRRATTSSDKKGLLMSLPEPIVLDVMEETRDVRFVHHPLDVRMSMG